MANHLENLTSQIYTRLDRLYGKYSRHPDFERLTKILDSLANDQSNGLKTNSSYVSPHYENLSRRQGDIFKSYADSLINASQEIKGMVVSASTGLVLAAPHIPAMAVVKTAVVSAVTSSAGKVAATAAGEAFSLAISGSGHVVMGGIAAAYISWECYDNIRKWWRGEISGDRCAKNIIDSTIQVAGGIGGGMAGAAVGTIIAPGVRTIFGGVIGGIVSSLASLRLSKYITKRIFHLPPTVALENAYRFLGINKKVSNDELNRAFRMKALKFHPDKGGKKEDFIKLQYHFSIIKASREEN